MRRFGPVLILAVLTAAAGPVFAEICSVDQKPAATLLVPYFEVSLAGPGVETLLSIHNAEGTPVIGNLVVWSDVGIPIFGIPFALRGYDVYTLDLRAILTTGKIPPTDIVPPGCTGLLPLGELNPAVLESSRMVLTGQPHPAFPGQCQGLSLPGRPTNAHGFITIDVVKSCTLLLPSNFEYFNDGIIHTRNALWGTTIFIDNAASLAHAMPMVHIEANATRSETAYQPNPRKPANYTFYARMVGWNGLDNREPLATDFGIRFYTVPPAGTTELFVWRDSKHPPVGGFPCAAGSPIKLGQRKIVAFNETSGAYTFPTRRSFPFPVMAQRVKVNGPTLVIPPAIGGFGWLFLNLNHSDGSDEVPSLYKDFAQAWVFGIANTATPPIFTGAFEAMQYDSACRGRIKLPRIP